MLAIYCRISGKKEEDLDTSIDTQIEKGKALALRLGLKYELFVDEGISGTKDEIEGRPQFANMLGEIKNKRISSVFTLYQDRLERNTLIWQLFVATLLKYNCNFYCGDKLVDFNDPQARFIADVLSASNAMYARLTSVRVKDSMMKRASEGRFRGQLPYGYKYDDKNHILINEDEAKYVKLMYEWSLEGKGSYTISHELNRLKVPTKFNKFEGKIKRIDSYTKEVTYFEKNKVKWRGNVVHDILTNTINKGKKYFNGEYYDVPAIVSEEIWDRAINNLKQNKLNVGKKVQYHYLLNGLLTCGHCNRKIVGKKRISSGDNSYKCKGKIYPNSMCKDSRAINIQKLETFIVKHLFISKELETHLSQLPAKEEPFDLKEKELENFKKHLKKLQKDLAHNYSLMSDSDFKDDMFIKDKVKELKTKVSLGKEKLSELEKEVYILKNQNSKQSVKAFINDYVEGIEFEDLKKLIHGLIDWIEIFQVKEEGKMGTFVINIKYKGFGEISTFLTNWFALKWIWISRTNTYSLTKEEIENSREIAKSYLEFNNIVIDKDYINELKQNGMTDEEIDRQNPYSDGFIGLESVSSQHSVIELKNEELLDFN
jgi:site-specific DNA recombinase